jgi:hypothetical protein
MAERKKGSSRQKKAAGDTPDVTGAQQQVAVRVLWETEPPAVYANFAQVQCRGEEFALVFASFSPEGPVPVPGEKLNAVNARIVSSVRLTPQTYFNLIQAMTRNWNRFVEDTFTEGGAPVFILQATPVKGEPQGKE